ncbi:hypothetical protein M758_4G096400 [Ceratodon purpureus]|nr:hypothetical protein M758_4G096400 [Ceratodon purpureus]
MQLDFLPLSTGSLSLLVEAQELAAELASAAVCRLQVDSCSRVMVYGLPYFRSWCLQLHFFTPIFCVAGV